MGALPHTASVLGGAVAGRADEHVDAGERTAFVPTDVFRCGDHYVVHCDLPGVDPGSLDVSVDADLVTIRAYRTGRGHDDVRWLSRERPVGAIVRQVRLDQPADGHDITATYTDGVLTLTLPVLPSAPPSARSRRTKVHRWSDPAHVLHGTPL